MKYFYVYVQLQTLVRLRVQIVTRNLYINVEWVWVGMYELRGAMSLEVGIF